MLDELSKQLGDRWLSLLALPGALFLAVAFTAHTLGWTAALSATRLIRQVAADAKSPVLAGLGGQVVVLLAVLAASAGVGIAAQALGGFIETTVLAAEWRGWPTGLAALAQSRVNRRQERWDGARASYDDLHLQMRDPDPDGRPAVARLSAAARNYKRIASERPERPTWSGDQLSGAAVRLERDLHLDLATLWPHLWLILPESERTQITGARNDMAQSAVLGGWALLYIPLTWWWWPALPLAIILAAVARRRFRLAAQAYALLLEAAARIHVGPFAAQLGLEHQGSITPVLGDRLMRFLKGTSAS
jgi:hypothetical protein